MIPSSILFYGERPMNRQVPVTERQISIPTDLATRLSLLAQVQHISEDAVIVKALTILFNLADQFDNQAAPPDWSPLSEGSLNRLWSNDEDARYDDWQRMYGTQSR